MSYDKLNEEMLLEIFRIAAPSYHEDKMAEYIIAKLTELQIPFYKDVTGNIYNLDFVNRPLLNAHMDTVQRENDSKLTHLVRISNYQYKATDGKIMEKRILRGHGVLGGDDKCGIYIMLEILSKYKNTNFIFSIGEEVGCIGISALMKAEGIKDKMEKCLYGLTLDRRYGDNIICAKTNNYGTQKFEDAIQAALKDYGYKPESGLSSDANHIREKMSCCNLSVAYFEPHSINEYVVLPMLLNTLNGVENIINTVTERFEAPTIPTYNYNYKGTGVKVAGNKKLAVEMFVNYFRKCYACGTSSKTTTILGKELCYKCLVELNENVDDRILVDKYFAGGGVVTRENAPLFKWERDYPDGY